MKTIVQLERKMKSESKLIYEYYEEFLLENKANGASKYGENLINTILKIKGEMKMLGWASGIDYKKYLPTEIKKILKTTL